MAPKERDNVLEAQTVIWFKRKSNHEHAKHIRQDDVDLCTRFLKNATDNSWSDKDLDRTTLQDLGDEAVGLTDKWKAKSRSLPSWLAAFRKRVVPSGVALRDDEHEEDDEEVGKSQQQEQEKEQDEGPEVPMPRRKSHQEKQMGALTTRSAESEFVDDTAHHDGEELEEAGLEPHRAQHRPRHVDNDNSKEDSNAKSAAFVDGSPPLHQDKETWSGSVTMGWTWPKRIQKTLAQELAEDEPEPAHHPDHKDGGDGIWGRLTECLNKLRLATNSSPDKDWGPVLDELHSFANNVDDIVRRYNVQEGPGDTPGVASASVSDYISDPSFGHEKSTSQLKPRRPTAPRAATRSNASPRATGQTGQPQYYTPNVPRNALSRPLEPRSSPGSPMQPVQRPGRFGLRDQTPQSPLVRRQEVRTRAGEPSPSPRASPALDSFFGGVW